MLKAANRDDKYGLEDFLEGILDCDVFIEDDSDGVLIMVSGHLIGVIEAYPCTLDALLTDGEDLLREKCMLAEIELVVDAIAEVEELDVEIEVDLDITSTNVIETCNRKVSHASSVVLQDLGEYPFTDPFPEDRTIEEWVTERFFPTFPGWKISVPGRPTMTLKKARLLGQSAAATSYSSASALPEQSPASHATPPSDSTQPRKAADQ